MKGASGIAFYYPFNLKWLFLSDNRACDLGSAFAIHICTKMQHQAASANVLQGQALMSKGRGRCPIRTDRERLQVAGRQIGFGLHIHRMTHRSVVLHSIV